MNERKILLFILSVIAYSMYSVHMWFVKQEVHTTDSSKVSDEIAKNVETPEIILGNETVIVKREVKKTIPLFIKDACSILDIFTQKHVTIKKKKIQEFDDNTITVIGITVFLIILVLNAVLDILKVKEEERARRHLNPDGERRQSLAEFANKKTLRRESSKFGLQLFQIAESFVNSDDDTKVTRQTRPYTRGDSTNSYLSDRKPQKEGSAPASVGDIPSPEPKLVKRQSVAKLFGLSDD